MKMFLKLLVLSFLTQDALAAFRSSAVTDLWSTSTSTRPVTMPTGIQVGDECIAYVRWASVSDILDTFTGWTLIDDSGTGVANIGGYSLHRRIADGSEGASMDLTLTGTFQAAIAFVACFSGRDTTAGPTASSEKNETSFNASGTAASPTALNVSGGDDLLVLLGPFKQNTAAGISLGTFSGASQTFTNQTGINDVTNGPIAILPATFDNTAAQTGYAPSGAVSTSGAGGWFNYNAYLVRMPAAASSSGLLLRRRRN